MSPPHKAKAPAGHGGEAESVEPGTRIVTRNHDGRKGFWDKAFEGKVRPAPIQPLIRCECPCCRWWSA
jgi:hypothetical protein